jgi:putative hydrolase of the HAD superfamily
MEKMIRAVSLDCAGTLVESRWNPAGAAVEAVAALGHELGAEGGEAAKAAFRRQLQRGWADYSEANRLRDEEGTRSFWRGATEAFLAAAGLSAALAEKVIELGEERAFGAGQRSFRLFHDTLPALDALGGEGYRLGVVSNWDYTLHRVLDELGIADRFEFAIASLEFGPEKPDAAIFAEACRRFGLLADEVAHVGDDPLDDLQGAREAGLTGVLIDRGGEAAPPVRIRSLEDLPEVLCRKG